VKVESRKSIQTEEESSVQFEHNPNVFIRSRKTGNNFFLLQWSKKLICTISNIIALVRREARTCYASSCAGECGSLRVLNNETKALWEIYELQAEEAGFEILRSGGTLAARNRSLLVRLITRLILGQCLPIKPVNYARNGE